MIRAVAALRGMLLALLGTALLAGTGLACSAEADGEAARSGQRSTAGGKVPQQRLAAAAPDAREGRSTDAQEPTARHRTPLGFSFAYPEEWTLQPQGHGAMLVPPDTPRDAQGSFAEVLVVAFEGAPGIESVTDPRLATLFDGLVGGARRTGEEAAAASGLGPGRMLTYAGDAMGAPVRYRIHVTVHEGTVAYVVHAAREDLAGRHRAEAAEVFRSFALEEPDLDRAVAGAWGRSTTGGSSTPGVGAVHSQSSEDLSLDPDGRARLSSAGSVSAGAPAVSGMSGGGPDSRQGRWGATDGWLTIQWQNGETVSFQYSVFTSSGAPALKLQTPGGEPVYFRPAR